MPQGRAGRPQQPDKPYIRSQSPSKSILPWQCVFRSDLPLLGGLRVIQATLFLPRPHHHGSIRRHTYRVHQADASSNGRCSHHPRCRTPNYWLGSEGFPRSDHGVLVALTYRRVRLSDGRNWKARNASRTGCWKGKVTNSATGEAADHRPHGE